VRDDPPVSSQRPRPWPVAAFFITTGVLHLTVARKFFEAIVPPWVPGGPKLVNEAAGYAEIAGGVLAVTPGAQPFARRYLVALLLAVYPANLHMAIRPQDIKGARGVPRWLLWARLPLQVLPVLWVQRTVRGRNEA
jgi:uncharacterized membrane protein